MPKKRNFYSVDRKGSDFHHDKKAKIGILSEEIMSYYRNVSSSVENGFDGDETLKDEFLTNVYNTLRDEGLQVSQNQTVSRILEVLFTNSKPQHMQGLFCQFCGELTVVVFDRFASHVFQSLIQYLPAMYEVKDEYSPYTIGGKSFPGCVEELCSFMESHLRDVMTHTYGSHVIRALLEALGGVKVREDVIRSRMSRGQSKDKVDSDKTEVTLSKALSSDFSANFKELTAKLIRLCNFEDHLIDSNFCPLLQTVLLILHKTNPSEFGIITETIIEKSGLLRINEDAPVDDVAKRLPDIVQSEVGSYLVELILFLASEGELEKLYNQIFKKRIIYFAVHPIANYVLQKVLSCVSQSTMMEELLTDILPYLEDILAVNYLGIVTKLAEACKRTETGQTDFMKALMTAFHCYEPEERQSKIIQLLASLQTYETFFGAGANETEPTSETPKESLLKTVNMHGSLVLQQLLQFTNTRLVSLSLLGLSATELMGLCCDKCGSHIIDAFFQSKTVFEKNKLAFLKKMDGLYINVACNRNGSRSLENIWKTCSVKQRINIAEDLVKNLTRLQGDQWGRFLYHNFALWKFTQRRQEWMNIQGANTKRQQILQDILQGTGGNKKKKRKKQTAQGQEADDESAVHSKEVLPTLTRKFTDVSAEEQNDQDDENTAKSDSQRKSGNLSEENVADNTQEATHRREKKKKKKTKKENALNEQSGSLQSIEIKMEIKQEMGTGDTLNLNDAKEGDDDRKRKKKKENLLNERSGSLQSTEIKEEIKQEMGNVDSLNLNHAREEDDDRKGKKRKRKSSLHENDQTKAPGNSKVEDVDQTMSKAKRKRKKEKKRLVRSQQPEFNVQGSNPPDILQRKKKKKE